MNPRGLTPALALLSLFLFPPEGAKVFRGKTQEALNLLGACYLLLPVLEGGGIDRKSGLPSQPRCHRTPWPRGELERLLTKLKGGADRPQIGMGQAEMRRPQPLPAFRKGGRSSGLLPRRCSPGPGGTPNRTGAWEGVSWPISHGDNPSTGRSPRLRRGASHTGPRCTWGSGPAAPQF